MIIKREGRLSDQTIDAGRLKKPVMLVEMESRLSDSTLERLEGAYKKDADRIGADIVIANGGARVQIIQPALTPIIQPQPDLSALAAAITALVESNHALIEAIMERDDPEGDDAPDFTPVEKYL